MSKLKTYGGVTFVDGKQVRTIVATTSKAKAAALVGVSLYSFNDYWGQTGNAHEIEVATSKPENVFCSSSIMCKEFVERDLV